MPDYESGVYILCRCGRLYLPGQELEMWACVRSHVDRDKDMALYQYWLMQSQKRGEAA